MTTEAEQPRLTIRDPHLLRALAHPARIAIIEYLMTGATATATECAEVCGLSPSATSYHLRALARTGLVEDAPSRGDGRERLWQSRVRGFDVRMDTKHDPEARAAERDLIPLILDRQDRQARDWLERSVDLAPEWQEAAVIAEGRLLMTAAELNDVNTAFQELIEPYRLRNRRRDPPRGARPVTVVLRSYPTD